MYLYIRCVWKAFENIRNKCPSTPWNTEIPGPSVACLPGSPVAGLCTEEAVTTTRAVGANCSSILWIFKRFQICPCSKPTESTLLSPSCKFTSKKWPKWFVPTVSSKPQQRRIPTSPTTFLIDIPLRSPWPSSVNCASVWSWPETGRNHQCRVSMLHLQHPIPGLGA